MQVHPIPHAAKVLLRQTLRHSPTQVRRLAARVPFSRFASVASRLLWGAEQVSWRDCTVQVNPGEVHGYFLYLLDDYASFEIAKLIELCRGARVFADVGANIGLVSLALARACPQLDVFAFEPDVGTSARLRRHLELNPAIAQRIHFAEVAASDSNGELHFEPSDQPSNPEVGHLVECGTSNAIAVRACRLDSFFDECGVVPDVVKVDVEGAELAVLRGMSELLKRGQPRAILMEVHGFSAGTRETEFKHDIQTLLLGAGYSLQRHENDEWRATSASADWPSRCHVLCLRQGTG